MTVALRPYQQDLEAGVYQKWQAGAQGVVAVSATGSGKTVLFSKFVADNKGASVAIAHRQELVSQMSVALARNGVRHRVIGSPALVRTIIRLHIQDCGYSFYHPNAQAAVAGVDTLVRMDPNDPWFKQVTLVVCDEGHHLLRENKWGSATAMFKAARVLAVTATPLRADGKGLGRHADGVIDAMVEGPSMRSLIDGGYLTPYRIFAAPSDVDVSHVPLAASGDFSPPKLREAIHGSKTIVGDVVAHYLKFASGKLGITFAVDVEAATEIAIAFKTAGVPAEVVTGKTPDTLRAAIMQRFKNREILQLVNVSLFDEGFDLPAIEVVSMVAHTASYGRYVQQFGRALRPLAGKERALIIDHVGNVVRHGLPDKPRTWSLDAREKRGRSTPDDVEALRACLNPDCLGTYERFRTCCPYCSLPPVPAGRSSPAQVDGDLVELDPAVLAIMRGDIAKIDDAPTLPYGAAPEVIGAVKRRHYDRQQAQAALRQAMKWYGGLHTAQGQPMAEAWKRFYMTFGTDVATAQALGTREAEELRARVIGDLAKYGIDGAVTAG